MRDIGSQCPERLFRKFRDDGDRNAFRLVVESTTDMLASRARRHGLSAADVDDVVQETYLAVLLGAASFDSSRLFAHWIVGIASNKAVDVQRCMRRRGVAPETPWASLPSRHIDDPEAAERHRALEGAILGLPRHYREVIVLRYQHGMSAEQIGQELSVPPSTVRTRVARGLEQLRRALSAYDPASPVRATA